LKIQTFLNILESTEGKSKGNAAPVQGEQRYGFTQVNLVKAALQLVSIKIRLSEPQSRTGAAKLRKATVSMEQLGSHWTNFHKI
jgi:hypothetical protein